jgi:TonB family protein
MGAVARGATTAAPASAEPPAAATTPAPPASAHSPAAASPDAPAAAAPRLMAIEKLHRLSGSPTIAPSDDVKKVAPASSISAAIVKVCMSADGKVESTKLVKPSGVPAYDEQLQSTIKSTWTFEPVATDGKPAPVCSTATFVAR